MQERQCEGTNGVMLFDSSLVPEINEAWFSMAFWRARWALRVMHGGRGGVAIITTSIGECVLRHYRRGGMAASLLGDLYLWRGAAQSRAFREWRLLAELHAKGLPVPQPVAAYCHRHTLFYRADLITRRIPEAKTLAQCLDAGELDTVLAEQVGKLIATFHRAGVWHADLNAHNVLVTARGLYLIDFDRGELRAPSKGWRIGNLERLRRSLIKLEAERRGAETFASEVWQPLLSAYEQAWRVT